MLLPRALAVLEPPATAMQATKRTDHVLAVILMPAVLLLIAGCSGGGGGGGPRVNNDHAYAVAIQPDGKIIAVGDSYSASHGWNFALVRYTSDGKLDKHFGSDGKVLTIMGDARARAVAIQSDGKVVAAGNAYDGFENFALLRYQSDGSLDTTFGSYGKVLVDMGGGALAVAIQPDGKVVAAGYSDNGIGYDFALLRCGSDGALDTTFGSGGKVITYSGGGLGSGASKLAIQSDGKIVAAGGSYIVRYNSDGSLDMTFGVGGAVTTGSYSERTSCVAVQTDGKVVAAGSSYNLIGSYNFALTRYGTDGAPDIAFGVGGRAVTTVMSLYTLEPAVVVMDPANDRIVAAAFSQSSFVITRNNSDGSPDTSFGFGGHIISSSGGYWPGISYVNDLAVQPDGKIVVVGSSFYNDASGEDFALARLNSDGSADVSFGSDGTVTTDM